MNTLKDYLKNQVETRQENQKEIIKRLGGDFAYEAEWVVTDGIINSIEIEVYNKAIKDIDQTIKNLIDYTTRSYNVRGTSTCQIRNHTKALRFEVYMRMIDTLKAIKETWIK